MNETTLDNEDYMSQLTPEEEAREKRDRIIGFIMFLLMLLAFFWLLFQVFFNGKSTNLVGTDNHPPLVEKPAPASTPGLPSASDGVHRRSGNSSSSVVIGGSSKSKSSLEVFNTYNYYSSSSPASNSNNPAVLGDSSYSASYTILESLLSGGASTSYTGAGSASYTDGGSTAGGDLAVGRSSSTNYRTQSGYNTDPEPRLTFVFDTSSIYLGTLSPSFTLSGSATFNVLAYNASGYVVQMNGTSLYNGSHYITPLATDTASAAGTEQFGVNTVANTSPSVGANPVQVPSSAFSFGVAGDGVTSAYATTNQFRFNSGETIASSNRDSGQTNYTLSIITNVSFATPATSVYSTELDFVATGTF